MLWSNSNKTVDRVYDELDNEETKQYDGSYEIWEEEEKAVFLQHKNLAMLASFGLVCIQSPQNFIR